MEPTIPPSDNDAEIAVLGAMLQDAGAVNTAEEMLVGLDFYKSKHETIFSAMLALSDKNEPVDIVTVANKLGQKRLDEIGGSYYLTELVARTPSAANVSYHCQIVKDKSLLRRLSNIGTEIKSYADETGADARYVLEASEKMIFDVSMQKTRGGFVSLPRIMHPTFEKIEGYHAKQGGITGIPSGLAELDALTCGWQNTDLILVAGRPSMGKTAKVLAALKNAAIDHGEPVGIFSLEMANYQLAIRLLCMDARVSGHALRSGKLSKSDFKKLAVSIGKFEKAKIFIDDTPALTVTELRARARRLKMQEGIKLLAVDYLQLMRVGNRDGRNYENRTVEVSIISQSLKALAKELDIPVIALSQLSRAVEQRGGDRRPVLSDLRESGSLEQDADVVIFVYRPEVYDRVEIEGMSELIVAKQRNGPLGTAKVMFLKDYTLFTNLANSGEVPTHWQDDKPPF